MEWIFWTGILIVCFFVFLKKKPLHNPSHQIPILLRQASRWSVASVQDEEPIVAYLHASYAAGYLWALEDLFTADEISFLGGIDYLLFKRELLANQDLVARRFQRRCPSGAIGSEMIRKVAGEA